MLRKSLIATGLLLGLSGCLTGQDISSIEQRPAPQVEFARFQQVLGGNGNGSQIEAAHSFLRAFNARYGDVVYVSGGANGRRAAIAQSLSDAYPALRVVERKSMTPQPLTLSLERAVVLAPGCDYFSRSVSDGTDHVPLPGLGCASDLSLAQMVADPRDLKTGKGGAIVDAETPTDVVQAVREERFSVTVGNTTTTGTSGSSGQ